MNYIQCGCLVISRLLHIRFTIVNVIIIGKWRMDNISPDPILVFLSGRDLEVYLVVQPIDLKHIGSLRHIEIGKIASF